MKGAIKKLLTVLLTLTSVFACACTSPAESPENETDTDIHWNDTDEEVATTKGVATNITLSIGGGESTVWAKVKNNFTLLPSTIWVYVELYSSETYQESYTTMKLEKTESVKDLDMGNSITISVPTNGEYKYWQARMRYKFDNRDWVTKTTSTFLYDPQGELADEIPPEQEKPAATGPFYTLQEAYNKRFLSQDELLSVAYYHHSEAYESDIFMQLNADMMGKNYHPIPKLPETLSDDLILSIKQSLYDLVHADADKDINLDDISIYAYYGAYKGGAVIRLDCSENRQPYPLYAVTRTDNVAGVKFYYSGHASFFSKADEYTIDNSIFYWKPENVNIKYESKYPVYTLSEAYGKGFLTQENLQSIAKYHHNNNLPRPDSLSEDDAETIKDKWVKYYKERHSTTGEVTATIHDYYGTYNDYAVVVIDRTGTTYIAQYAPISFEIGGVQFTFQLYGPQVYVIKLEQNEAEISDKQFFSLDKAYENNLLSEDNLKSIAQYYNTRNSDEKTERPELDEATRESIKIAYCKQLGIEKYDGIGIPSTYFGTYNNCTVVQISTSCDSEVGGDPICYPEYIIGGVTFYWYSPLMVYRKI